MRIFKAGVVPPFRFKRELSAFETCGCRIQSMQEMEKFIALGRITRPHGIRGAVNIRIYGDDAAFAGHSHFFLPEHSRVFKMYELASARIKKPGTFIVQFSNIQDRNSAEKISGLEVFVDRESMPGTAPDEAYWHDLIGMKVLLPGGELVGRIHHIMETAGHDVYVVSTQDGREIFIPAVRNIVTDIDIEAGKCTISPPPGLLEANDH